MVLRGVGRMRRGRRKRGCCRVEGGGLGLGGRRFDVVGYLFRDLWFLGDFLRTCIYVLHFGELRTLVIFLGGLIA